MVAKYEEKQREAVYRIYMADQIRLYLTENKAIKARYADLARYTQQSAVDNRSAEEIVADVIARNGLIRKEEAE